MNANIYFCLQRLAKSRPQVVTEAFKIVENRVQRERERESSKRERAQRERDERKREREKWYI